VDNISKSTLKSEGNENNSNNNGNNSQGVIYKVPGKDTPSGKPYVGSANNLKSRTKTAKDGRNRSNAEVIGKYPIGNKKARRQAEQQGMNNNGGREKLDNKRNEIAEDKWADNGVIPPTN